MAENTKASEELEIANFTGSGNFYTSAGEEVNYTNGLRLNAKFSDKELKDSGKYYVSIDAFGGTINGKAKLTLESKTEEFKTIDLTKYTPVREGYTFNGWKAKKDGSGDKIEYIYWRIWDKNEETDKKFEKDTLIKEESGYERYKNVTLYASWTKNSETPDQSKDTVKKIESTGNTKANIEFSKEINKNYKLEIKKVEVIEKLANKDVKFIAAISTIAIVNKKK